MANDALITQSSTMKRLFCPNNPPFFALISINLELQGGRCPPGPPTKYVYGCGCCWTVTIGFAYSPLLERLHFQEFFTKLFDRKIPSLLVKLVSICQKCQIVALSRYMILNLVETESQLQLLQLANDNFCMQYYIGHIWSCSSLKMQNMTSECYYNLNYNNSNNINTLTQQHNTSIKLVAERLTDKHTEASPS